MYTLLILLIATAVFFLLVFVGFGSGVFFVLLDVFGVTFDFVLSNWGFHFDFGHGVFIIFV